MLGLEAVYSGRNGDEEDSGSLTDFFFSWNLQEM